MRRLFSFWFCDLPASIGGEVGAKIVRCTISFRRTFANDLEVGVEQNLGGKRIVSAWLRWSNFDFVFEIGIVRRIIRHYLSRALSKSDFDVVLVCEVVHLISTIVGRNS